MNINAENYKPKEKGVSDFYSWNFYRWLKKQELEPDQLRKVRIFDSGSDFSQIYIGYKHEFGVTGFALRGLCSCGGYGKFPMTFCCGDRGWPDITEEFYKEYERIGVCAIHGDMAHEWVYASSYRWCDFCKKVERKEIKIVEQVNWVDAV